MIAGLFILFGSFAWACSPLPPFECPHGTVTIKLEVAELAAVEKANEEFDQRLITHVGKARGTSCFNFDDLSFIISDIRRIAREHGGKVCRKIIENVVDARPDNAEVLALAFQGKEPPEEIVKARARFSDAQKKFSRKHLSE